MMKVIPETRRAQ